MLKGKVRIQLDGSCGYLTFLHGFGHKVDGIPEDFPPPRLFPRKIRGARTTFLSQGAGLKAGVRHLTGTTTRLYELGRNQRKWKKGDKAKCETEDKGIVQYI